MEPFIVDQPESLNDARARTLSLPRGEVKTPVFMPVGTQATVKRNSSTRSKRND